MLALYAKLIFKVSTILIAVISVFFIAEFASTKIELDLANPSIHGVEVTFAQQMSYIYLTGQHLEYGFKQEEIGVGKILTVTDSQRYKTILSYGGHAQKLKYDTKYRIFKTYRREYDWLTSPFNDDARYAILKTVDEEESLLSLYDFYYSAEPKFSERNWTYGDI